MLKRKADKKNQTKKKLLFTAGLIMMILVTLLVICINPILKSTMPTDYDKIISKYAKEYSVDEALIYAVIKTESSFNAEAVSPDEARGLMQITKPTFEWLQTKTGESYAVEDLFDPEICIKYGVLFLSMLLEEFTHTETALAAYNAGRTRINGWLKDSELSDDGETLKYIPISETRYYVKKVMAALEMYEKLYNM